MIALFHVAVVCVSTIEVIAASRNTSRHTLRLLIFLGYGLIHGIAPLVTSYSRLGSWTLDDSSRLDAAIASAAGVVGLSFGWHLASRRWSRTPRRSTRSPERHEESFESQRQIVVFALLSLGTAIAATLYHFQSAAGSISNYVAGARFEYRGEGGTFGIFALQLVGLAAVPGFIAPYCRRKKDAGALLAASAGFATWYYFASRGTRSIPLGIVGALFVGYLLRRRIPYTKALAVIVIIVGGGALAAGLYTVRQDLGQASVGETAEALASPGTYSSIFETDPLDYHQYLIGAARLFPSEFDYLHGAVYRRVLFFPLPSGFLGLKPPDTHITFGEAVVGPNTGASIPPSLPGEGWINLYGPIGAVASLILVGVLIASVDRMLYGRRLVLLCLGPAIARLTILLLRGQLYEVLFIGLSGFAVSYALWRLSGVRVAVRGQEARDAGRLSG